MTYTYIERVSEKYKIGDSVTINENRTNDIQRSEEEDKKQGYLSRWWLVDSAYKCKFVLYIH